MCLFFNSFILLIYTTYVLNRKSYDDKTDESDNNFKKESGGIELVQSRYAPGETKTGDTKPMLRSPDVNVNQSQDSDNE